MTAIVGILCTDGVVIATDSSATFTSGSARTIEQPTEKLKIVSNKVIIAGTGQIGLGQRFEKKVDDSWKGSKFRGDPIDVCRVLCQETIADFASTQVGKGQYGALVAFPVEKRFYLCEFATADLQPELKLPHPKIWHVSMGSGQVITDPFMALLRKMLWANSQPTVQEGIFAAVWALDHAVDCNTGGVNGPVHVAVLKKEGTDLNARYLTDDDLGEHRVAIAEVQGKIQECIKAFGTPKADAPAVPKPGGG